MKFEYIINNDYKTVEEFFEFHKYAKPKRYLLEVEKNIFVNDIVAYRRTKIKPGDKLTLIFDGELDFIPDKGKIKVLYEDDYLLIIDKPYGILIHPDTKEKRGTLVNLVANYYKEHGLNIPVRYCHRLDVNTTGVIVFAKDPITHSYFNYLFENHIISRKYAALVSGVLKGAGTINAPIGSDRHSSKKRIVSKTGQVAITHYNVILENNDYSLLKLKLETGRTHQIRVHLAYIKHPIVGDDLYNGEHAKCMMLHSESLEFIKPYTNEKILVSSEIPQAFLNYFRK